MIFSFNIQCFVKFVFYWKAHTLEKYFSKKNFTEMLLVGFYEHQHFQYFSHCYAPKKWASAGNEKIKKQFFLILKGLSNEVLLNVWMFAVIEFQICYFLDSNFQCCKQFKKKISKKFQKIYDPAYPTKKTDLKTSNRSLSCVC